MSDIRRLTLDIWRYTSEVWLLTWDTWHQTYHNICHQTCVLLACLTSNVWYQTSDVTSEVQHHTNIMQRSDVLHQTSQIKHISDVWHQTSYICHTSDAWHQICVLLTSDIWHKTYIRHQMSDIRHQTSYMRRCLQILNIRHLTSNVWC